VLPTYTFLSSVINNDNLIMAIGAGIVYCVVQPKASWKNSAAIGILLGLAMLTKLTSVVYAPFIVLFLLIGLVRKTTGWSIAAHILLILAIAALLWSPLAWRNWTVYGSVTAEDVGNVVGQWESSFRAIWFALTNWQASFWAVSGIHNNISFFPSLGIFVFYLALIGLLRGLFSKKEKLASFARKDINLIIASALAVLINYLLVIRFGLLHFQGQGRFFFPLLVPLSLLMAIGLRMYSATDSEKARIHLTGAFITYAMSFTSFSLSMFTL
jgi:4-amino-4-deoxy-L-arabinose transferase-like glycosyltransferase